MPISQPVYTDTMSSPPPPSSSCSPAAPASPPSCAACPLVDGQVPPRLAAEAAASEAGPLFRCCSGRPAMLLPPVTAGMLVRLFPLDNIFINRRNSTVWQFPQNTIPGRHAFPVVAPPPNRRHRLLLGVLIGQRHGVLHGGHIVGVRTAQSARSQGASRSP